MMCHIKINFNEVKKETNKTKKKKKKKKKQIHRIYDKLNCLVTQI